MDGLELSAEGERQVGCNLGHAVSPFGNYETLDHVHTGRFLYPQGNRVSDISLKDSKGPFGHFAIPSEDFQYLK